MTPIPMTPIPMTPPMTPMQGARPIALVAPFAALEPGRRV